LKKYLTLQNGLTVVGLVLGYFYWHFYACTEGCAITSRWYGSMAAGGLFGNLFGGIISDLLIKNKK
jgi:hypothetical protein